MMDTGVWQAQETPHPNRHRRSKVSDQKVSDQGVWLQDRQSASSIEAASAKGVLLQSRIKYLQELRQSWEDAP